MNGQVYLYNIIKDHFQMLCDFHTKGMEVLLILIKILFVVKVQAEIIFCLCLFLSEKKCRSPPIQI